MISDYQFKVTILWASPRSLVFCLRFSHWRPAIPISHNLMDDLFVEGRTSDSSYDLEVMPFIEKKRRICDLAESDAEDLLHTLEDFELQLDDIIEDLPINFTSGLQQLRKMLENTGVEVHWHSPCSKCLIHCRLISFFISALNLIVRICSNSILRADHFSSRLT